MPVFFSTPKSTFGQVMVAMLHIRRALLARHALVPAAHAQIRADLCSAE